jgi:hypothetical protein
LLALLLLLLMPFFSLGCPSLLPYITLGTFSILFMWLTLYRTSSSFAFISGSISVFTGSLSIALAKFLGSN